LNMPDLQGQFLSTSTDCSGGTCKGSAQATATDGSQDHGTMVASSMAAVGNNGEAIAGVTWDAKILAIKTDLTSSAIVAGIKYAIAHHVRIINESFGGPVPSHAEYDALQDAQDHDILVVVAAGNSDSDNDLAGAFYPANYSAPTVIFPHTDASGNPLPGSTSTRPGLANVVAVGASNNTDSLTSWSQWGSFNVGLLAPGDGVIALQRGTNDGLISVAGTSFASPITAGSAALVGEYLTEVKSQTPDWHDLKAHVLNGSEPSQTTTSIDGRSATGRLNTFLAMQDLSHGVIVVRSASIDNSAASNDGEINPNEDANLVVTVANVGPDETDVQGTLSHSGSQVTVPAGTATQDAGAIQSSGTTPNVVDGTATMSFPVHFNAINGNQSLLFKLHVTTASGGAADRFFYLQAGKLQNGVTVSGNLTRNPQDDFQDWHVDVPAGGKNLVIWSSTSGGVDIDLIAMKSRLPQYLETLGVDNPSSDPEFQQYIEPNAQTSGRQDGDESIAYDGLSNPFDAAKPPLTSAGTYHVVVVNFTGRSGQAYKLTACYAPAGTDQISFDGNYEYDEDAGTAKLTLLRSGTSGAVSVAYATENGGIDSSNPSAIAGTNYTTGKGTVSWASGDGAAKTFTIPLTNTGKIGTASSGFLHFRVALSSPGGGAQLGCIKTADVAITTASSSSGGGTPPPASGKSGGGVLDLFSLLGLGLALLRRRYLAK
ncbi:MAG TPA: S8 family serine peptidase, partial [Gammaproteobacteria bacterium]